MKAIIIYHSRTGNTKLLAEKIKQRLEFLNISVKIFQDKNFKDKKSITEFDIIGLGSPTHYYQVAKEFKEFLQMITNFDLKGKKLIIFATGVAKSSPPKICNDITKIMKPTGVEIIAKIGCVKKPTEEIDLEIEKAIDKDIF
ncbi:MAG: flavodoxin family protein [Candidatus Thorarchaeota archaeon]